MAQAGSAGAGQEVACAHSCIRLPGVPSGRRLMWWLIGLAAWLAIGLELALFLGPRLKRCREQLPEIHADPRSHADEVEHV